jgi:maltose alpha-D-glucosyltransferase/alpha-amylase
VPNQGDGWSYSLAALQDYYAKAEKRLVEGEAAPTMELPLMETLTADPPEAFVAMTDDYLQSIRTLGRRTAEFHLALSEEKKNPAFKPEKSTAIFTEQLAESVKRQIQEALPMLSAKLTALPAEVRLNGDRVLRNVPILLDRISEMTDKGEKLGYLIRHHGDYHLGQVLRTDEDDFILLDFEGEPLRPLAERRRKGSPLKDLAGMMRSFHYAAETALPEKSGKSAMYEKLLPWSKAWHEWMSSIFLRSYFQTAAGAPFLPTVDAGFILEVFLLEKVFYELKYELNNRPDWVHIPLAGIVDIIDKKRLSTR